MTYNRKDLSVSVTLTQQKGYTMKDISAIDDRVKKLEYYTVLNALALDTTTTSVRDSTGNIERFKNGIFADPFNDRSLSRTENTIECRYAIDSGLSIARPYFNDVFINQQLLSSASSNIRYSGRLALLDYDHEKIVAQPYATAYRNCTEGYYRWKGNLTVFPSFDNNNSVTNAAPQYVDVDLAGAFGAAADAGAFKDINTTYSAPVQTGSSTSTSGSTRTETNYFSQTATTTVSDVTVQSTKKTQDLGNYVKDVSFLPYMRARQVAIVATGLKPNSTFYAFFDGTPVGDYCAPATVQTQYALSDGSGRLDATKITQVNAGQANQILTQSGALGSVIKSSSYGHVYLVFNIPDNKFRAGDRTFTLSDNSDINSVQSTTSTAAGVYSSSSLAVTQQQLSFNVIEPTFTPKTSSTNNTITWTDTTTSVLPPPPPPPQIDHPTCFDGEANVLMADGSLKPIKDIVVGDKVAGRKNKSVNVFEVEYPTLGPRKMYSWDGMWAFVSEEHPFLGADGEWYAPNPESYAVRPPFNKDNLKKLVNGTVLLTVDGEFTVNNIVAHDDDPNKPLYNLMLDDDEHIYVVEGYYVHNRDPVGETFIIKDLIQESIPGVYLTQIGVYFQSKSSSLGVTCKVVETLAGLPNSNRLLGSAYLHSSQVSVSENGTTETVFTFDTPILLPTDGMYAFYIEPEATNPDYNIWISDVGGTDKSTNVYISQQPFSGMLVASSNAGTWTSYQSQDVKFNLYRAKFKVSSGTAVFRNPNEEYLSLNNITRKSSGVPISIGDIVYAANASNLSEVLYSNNSLFPVASVKSIDEVTGVCILRNTNGLFTNNTSTPNFSNIRFYRMPDPSNTQYVSASYLVGNAVISTIDDKIYHGMVPKFNFLAPVGTAISSAYYGTSNSTNSFQKDSTPVIAPNESLYLYRDFERVVRSYSNEIAQGTFGANGSSTYVVTLNSGNYYISPAIDLGVKTFNYIQNDINNDNTNEHTRYGNARTRYISKIVTLNSKAEDLIVYVTGYMPVNSTIEVYAKFFLNGGDPGQFDNKLWTKLPYKSATQPQSGLSTVSIMPNSSPSDPNDYREYTFGLPTSADFTSGFASSAYSDQTYTPAIGTLTYTDENGGIQRGFNMFGLKVVLLSSDPVVIPSMRDIRAIALQV